MHKTLVVKLEDVVENNNFLKFGEIRIPCYGNGVGTQNKVNNEGGLISCKNKPVIYNIIGDVTFTDGTKTLDSTKGTNEIKAISTDKDFTLQCLNKYNICILRLTQGIGNINVKSDFDVSTLGILPSLTDFYVYCCHGDLNETVRGAKQLKTLIVNTNDVSLSLDSIPTGVKTLILSSISVTGDIAELRKLNLSDMTDWAYVINQNNVSGDLADIPSSVCYINLPIKALTWTKGKRTEASLLAINTSIQKGFATATDVDNMFIDQATCTYKGNTLPNQHDGSVHKLIINCVQSYTPSSEAQIAISKIYAKGITEIKVNNVSMEQYK